MSFCASQIVDLIMLDADVYYLIPRCPDILFHMLLFVGGVTRVVWPLLCAD